MCTCMRAAQGQHVQQAELLPRTPALLLNLLESSWLLEQKKTLSTALSPPCAFAPPAFAAHLHGPSPRPCTTRASGKTLAHPINTHTSPPRSTPAAKRTFCSLPALLHCLERTYRIGVRRLPSLSVVAVFSFDAAHDMPSFHAVGSQIAHVPLPLMRSGSARARCALSPAYSPNTAACTH